MTPATERRLLQIVVAVACIVPFTAGGGAVLKGVASAHIVAPPIDLDSHFRYLSGLLLGIGFGFLSCVPGIERRGDRFRLLGAIVVVGGFGRLLSLIELGVPGRGHVFGLCMELGVVPLLMLWQARLARRYP